MRTTVEISDELMRRAKRRAADEGISFRAVVEAALRRHLSSHASRATFELRWTVEHGRLRPGVELDDREALSDAMDDRP